MAANWWDSYKRADEEEKWWESYRREDEPAPAPVSDRPAAAATRPTPAADTSLIGNAMGDEFGSAIMAEAAPADSRTLLERPAANVAAPPSKPLIERRGAPVSEETFQSLRNKYDAATPEQRAALLKQKGYLGSVYQSIQDQYNDLDQAISKAPVMRAFDTRREARASQMVSQGLHPDSATSLATQDAARGSGPRQLQQVKPSDFEFDTRAEYERPKDTMVLEDTGGLIGARTVSPRGIDQAAAAMKAVGGKVENQFRSSAAGAWQFIGDLTESIGDATGLQGVSSLGERLAIGNAQQQQEAKRKLEAIGTNPNKALAFVEEGVSGAITSVAPFFVAGPTAGVSLMVGQVFGDEYGNGKAAGLDGSEAFARASMMSAAELIGEVASLPTPLMKGFKSLVKGVPAEEIMPTFARYLAKENAAEQVTTALNFATDKWAPVGITPDAGLDDYLKAVGDTFYQTTAQTLAVGAAGRVAAPITRKLQEIISQPANSSEFDRAAAAEFSSPIPAMYAEAPPRGAPVVPPTAPVTNFTPPDSATRQAGLVDIEVPVPNTPPALPEINTSTEQQFGLDKLRTRGGNVGTAGVPGGLAGAGGAAGGGIVGGGLDAAGLGAGPGAGGAGGIAGGVRADGEPAVPAGGAAGQPPAGVTQPPAKIWAGRAGDGYMQSADAQQALPGLQRKYPALSWSLQQDSDGKFFWSGTTRGDASGAAITGAAGQGLAGTTGETGAQQAGAAGAGLVGVGQVAVGQPGQSGGAATVGGTAPNEPAFTLNLAPTAPLQAAGRAITMLKSARGVEVELYSDKLTDQQKVASAMARLVGKTATYVSQVGGAAEDMPNGFVIPGQDKNIYLDSNSSDGALFVMMHEGVHALPQPIREKLVTTIKGLTKTEMRGDFASKFGYDANNDYEIDNEIAAFMTQAVSKRADFWQELRTKMGDGDFVEVAKVILDKLTSFLDKADKTYGEDFLKRYATDAVAVRDAVSTAYAEAMRAQGQQAPAATGEALAASNRSRLGLDFKDVVKRTPELQAAAAKVQAGEMTAAEYDKLVNETKPVEPYTSVPQPASMAEAVSALRKTNAEREGSPTKDTYYGRPSQTLKAGDPVGLRLDIPSYSKTGTWVVTVHEPRKNLVAGGAGTRIGYESVAAATDVQFSINEKGAIGIAAGKEKNTIATMEGKWKPTTPAEAKLKADQALKSKDWVQVGMDPERHSYFYDRATMRPVTAAAEVIQIGPLVLAKNPTYGEKSEFMFSNKAREPIKLSDYRPETGNYNKQQDMVRLLNESVPAETIAKADGFVDKYFKERQAVTVSPEDRLKAEILLRPRMQAAEQVKPEYDQKILDIAARTGAAGQMLAPIKGLKRAAEKLAIEENFNVDNIKDLLRSTIVVDSYADAPAIVDEIRKEFDVVRVKDRAGAGVLGQDVSAAPRENFGGYADILVNIRMPNGTIGEIQINTPAMLAAKDEQGHKLYEAAREQPEGSPLRAEIYDAMRVLYDAVFEAANRRQPSAQARNLASEIGAPRAGSESTAVSSSPESASLNTDPSGNLTNSSPENEATNSQPGGKEAGTFIEGSPDKASVSQSLYPSNKPPRRGADRVGDFDVRTMKDGTIVVYGDSAAIRTQIPDDVKGRVTKEGIVFTNAAAPRVKAALAGRKTAYSRGGEVVEKLPMKGGKYLGAPEKYNTPAKITGLRKSLRKLALEGERGRYWYENSSREVLAMVGGNVQEARKFVALLAIYSPQAKVDANSTFALRAWSQYKAGQPISVKTGVMDAKAQAALDDVDAFWSGEKTGNFFFNLLREIDPSTAGKQGATIDMWMMRAGEYNNDAPTATQYSFMENETNRLAQELGWEPQQVQAAIWVAMKARMENSGVKKRTEASSEKNGWIRFDYPMKNGRPVKTRVILDSQKHRDNWLKHAMEHVPTREDTEQAKFDFSDGVRRHIGQLSFEARPGRSTDILPGIHDAPYAQQVEFQQAVLRAFYDEDGNDMLAMQLGLLAEPSDLLRPGVWQGDVSPSTQKRVAMAPAKGEAGKSNVDPAQAELLNVYASVAGLVARQEGVGWHRPFYAGAKRDANGLDIDIGRALNPAEARDLEAAIGKWMDSNGHKDWQNSFALISSPTGIRAVNFGIITNDVLQSEIVKVAEGVLPDFEYRVFASSGDMPTNDWKVNPNGQGYIQRIGAAGRSDVLDWARGVLAPRVQRVFEQFAEKYQWGDPGRIQFSKRAAGDGSGRATARSFESGSLGTPERATPQEALSPLPGAPQVRGFTGPDPQLVAVAEKYARDNDITLRRQAEYAKVDPIRAKRIANAYEVMRHAPQDPKVKEAYQNLIRQTVAQYKALEDAGYKFWFIDMNSPENVDYVSTPWNAMRDIRTNKQMGVFPTAGGFGSGATELDVNDNPLLQDTGFKWPVGGVDGKTAPVLANDLFRAVHDAFGHGLEGAGFRAQGEENAWQAHVRLFTGSAVGAITSETRGQNSWLNYGPYGEKNRTAKVEDTVFADQKTGLMPEWTWMEGRVGDMPDIMASNRALPKVSPQSALNEDIDGSARNLSQAINALRAGKPIPSRLVIGRLPHVLNMLGARTQEFDIASSIVKKIFVEKHEEDFGGVNVRDFVRSIYQPAMVLKSKDGSPREFELVLPITGDKGAVIVPIKVSVDNTDPLGAVMSAYQKEVSSAKNPKEMTIMRRVQQGNLLYVDPMLAKQAVTGRPRGGDRDGVRLNDNFLSWQGVWPTIEKLIQDRKVKTDVELMKWIGDNYKPSSSPTGWEDAPAFSNRGINIRNDGDNRYADLIVDGQKTMESRATDSLRPYVGRTVGIIRTGEGPAKLIGSARIGEPIEVDERQFRELEGEHLVPRGSTFDIKPGQTKFLYPITEAKRFDRERDVTSRGIVAREVEFSNRAQTETPEFKRWFGDSKVVDAEGQPLVVYHGTAVSSIEAFEGNRGVAGHFAFDPEFASGFADAAGMAEQERLDDGEEDIGDGAQVYAVYLKAAQIFDARNPSHLKAAGIGPIGDWSGLESKVKQIKGAGFDSYYDFENSIKEPPTGIAVFRPEQIKSATGNSGAFDPENPDIRFSKRAAKPEMDKDVVSLFKDLQDSRGLGLIRAQERVDAHPMAETIRRVNDEFLDILGRLEESGAVKINCK